MAWEPEYTLKHRFAVPIAIFMVLTLLPAAMGNPIPTAADAPKKTISSQLRENCRLLGIVQPHPIETAAIRELLDNFRYTTHPQRAGWSIAVFSNIDNGGRLAVPGEPVIIRSDMPVYDDEIVYDAAIRLAARLAPDILLAHLRNASSGCTDVADPHPFHRIVNGRHLLFIHNGSVWGHDLDTVINTLLVKPLKPSACPDTPIDSEFLFLYLIQLMETEQKPMLDIVTQWARTLRLHLTYEWNALNCIVTDGRTLWAVRCTYRPDRFYLRIKPMDRGGYALSTEALGSGWKIIPNLTAVELRQGSPPVFREILSPDAMEIQP